MIQFVLNGEPHEVSRIDPNTTVLAYLRETLRLTGTKEGCASGDCGACTVVVAELHGNGLRYLNINACITLLGAVHGKHLITVEGLTRGGVSHPVQQAMVDEHGSQCGFCTPGFVMSLFSLYKNHRHYSRAEVEDSLAGNLCRCTGYRPIIDAAFAAAGDHTADEFSKEEKRIVAMLREIKDGPDAEMGFRGRRYFAPRTLAGLTNSLGEYPGATLLAGGTDLNLEITQQLRRFSVLIDIREVDELQRVDETENGYSIGAAVTYADCFELIADQYPDFGRVLRRLGSSQIRNTGTLGGNLGNASPIADTPPALIALDAELRLVSAAGERIIPVSEYYLDYKRTALRSGEFIRSVELPKARPGYEFRMYKVSKRLDDDISASCGAINLKVIDGKVADAGIAFGGLAATPKRAAHCEAKLVGQPWEQATVDAAKDELERDYQPIDDIRASAAYRMQVSKNMLQRYWLETAGNDSLTRIDFNAA